MIGTLDWFQLANSKEDKTIRLRRYLYQCPELSFEEFQTHDYVVNRLSQLSCSIETPIGRNGIKTAFKGLGTGPTIALRAGFDALSVEKLNNVPYKSKSPGCMHACGHDSHTAILFTVTEILDEHKYLLESNVVLMFRYDEEIIPGDSQEMIDAGCLENVDRVYDTHLWSSYPTGTIHSRAGTVMASPGEFSVTFKGRDGHGAKPHKTIDLIVVMAKFILGTQEIISRTVDPVRQAVLSFGMIQAGTADSVIPNQTFCKGTVGTFDSDIQNHVMDRMDKLLQGLAIANDVSYDLNCIKGHLPVHSSEETYQVIKEAANDLRVRFNESGLMIIGKGFSHYLKVRLDAFFLTGCGNESRGITTPHHNPKFDIDEKSLKYAVAVFLKIIELKQIFKTN